MLVQQVLRVPVNGTTPSLKYQRHRMRRLAKQQMPMQSPGTQARLLNSSWPGSRPSGSDFVAPPAHQISRERGWGQGPWLQDTSQRLRVKHTSTAFCAHVSELSHVQLNFMCTTFTAHEHAETMLYADSEAASAGDCQLYLALWHLHTYLRLHYIRMADLFHPNQPKRAGNWM